MNMRQTAQWFGVAIAALVLGTLSVSQVQSQAATGTIQIVQGGIGQGTVTSRPAGINCVIGADGPTGMCEASFPAGTKVRLRAEAATNSKFEGWAPTNSCRKAPRVEVRAGAVHTCQSVFALREGTNFLLQAVPEGSGRITSNPAGIDCIFDSDAGTLTGQCAAVYPRGTVVTLTPTPAVGWVFSRWSGNDRDCNDGAVTMNAARRCIATFVRSSA